VPVSRHASLDLGRSDPPQASHVASLFCQDRFVHQVDLCIHFGSSAPGG
jgi:hypothetical protein